MIKSSTRPVGSWIESAIAKIPDYGVHTMKFAAVVEKQWFTGNTEEHYELGEYVGRKSEIRQQLAHDLREIVGSRGNRLTTSILELKPTSSTTDDSVYVPTSYDDFMDLMSKKSVHFVVEGANKIFCKTGAQSFSVPAQVFKKLTQQDLIQTRNGKVFNVKRVPKIDTRVTNAKALSADTMKWLDYVTNKAPGGTFVMTPKKEVFYNQKSGQPVQIPQVVWAELTSNGYVKDTGNGQFTLVQAQS